MQSSFFEAFVWQTTSLWQDTVYLCNISCNRNGSEPQKHTVCTYTLPLLCWNVLNLIRIICFKTSLWEKYFSRCQFGVKIATLATVLLTVLSCPVLCSSSIEHVHRVSIGQDHSGSVAYPGNSGHADGTPAQYWTLCTYTHSQLGAI